MKDFEIRCDKSHLETNNFLYGKFTLGPFLPGQGTTFGNALRRSLLAELSGLAITAFEVVGVMQEFSTLPGLRESILDLSLNLKQVVLTGILPYSTPPIGFLYVRGPAIVKASDLKLPAGIYCSSPDQYIATLGSTGMLNIKFLVSVGKGYSIQPYSLYRSLSKIRLQPTPNFENINTQDVFSSNSFERSNLEDSQSIFNSTNNIKETENKIFVNPLNSNLSTSSPLRDTPSSIFPTINPLEGVAIQNQLGNEKTSKDKQNNPVQSSMHSVGVNKEPNKTENFLFNEKQLQSTNLESSLLTFENNTTTLNSSESTNVQTQIFQRINPHQVLPIDAVFTPVSRVNFLTQVNDRFETPRENIVLEIWTNGSIHPKRALEEATLSLVQNFDVLLKKIHQASSFYKGLRYWTYLQPSENTVSSNELMGDKTNENTTKSSMQQIVSPNSYQVTKSNFNDLKSTSVDKTFKENLWDSSQSIYNLDVGNLNLSLQTYIILKKAKIHTLSQLLTFFSLKDNKFILNSAKIEVETNLFLNEKIIEELNNVVSHFS